MDVTVEQEQAVPRRSRPRNRRAQILDAAAELFAHDGYDQTAMTDIAAAVGIGPSALYRHFPGKQQLLAEVITTGLRPVHQLIADLDLTTGPAALFRLAALGLTERHLCVLWQREARYLNPEDRTAVRGELRRIEARLTDQVHAVRPDLGREGADLLAWSLVALLTSPSFHHVELARPAHDELLATLMATVLETKFALSYGPPSWPAPGKPALIPASRREALLMQAVAMFAADGYSEVGIEDIGAAVDIAGPSVYNHYPSKQDMLTIAFQRGAGALFTDLTAAYATATTPADALRSLLGSYIEFSLVHHDLVGLLITETGHLPAGEQQRARQAQRDYLNEWTQLLNQIHTDLRGPTAQIRVHAAVDLINNAVRIPHLRHNPGLATALTAVCTRLLQLHPDHGQADSASDSP